MKTTKKVLAKDPQKKGKKTLAVYADCYMLCFCGCMSPGAGRPVEYSNPQAVSNAIMYG